jgi:hypothetical protein
MPFMTIQNICIKVCFKLRKTSWEMLATECWFIIITQKVNISFLSGKMDPLHAQRKVKKSNHTPRAQWWFYLRALFITNLLLQTKQFTSITSRRFYNETGSLLKLSKTVAEPRLGDSLHQCVSSHRFVSTTIFGCQKHACGPHPLNLPNTAPCKLFLLPWIKSQVLGYHFHNVPEVQIYSPTTLHSIPKSRFQKWQKHQTHCINFKRDYKKNYTND